MDSSIAIAAQALALWSERIKDWRRRAPPRPPTWEAYRPGPAVDSALDLLEPPFPQIVREIREAVEICEQSAARRQSLPRRSLSELQAATREGNEKILAKFEDARAVAKQCNLAISDGIEALLARVEALTELARTRRGPAPRSQLPAAKGLTTPFGALPPLSDLARAMESWATLIGARGLSPTVSRAMDSHFRESDGCGSGILHKWHTWAVKSGADKDLIGTLDAAVVLTAHCKVWSGGSKRSGRYAEAPSEPANRFRELARLLREFGERRGGAGHAADVPEIPDQVTLGQLAKAIRVPSKKTLQNRISKLKGTANAAPEPCNKVGRGIAIFRYSELLPFLMSQWPERNWPSYEELQSALHNHNSAG